METTPSKPTPIHGPVHKYDLNYSYPRSHFNQLPQQVTIKLIYRLSHKFSYASKIFDPVINEFSTDEVKIHLYICYNLIVTFGRIGFCLGFSNTSNVDILYGFRKQVVDKVKTDICI